MYEGDVLPAVKRLTTALRLIEGDELAALLAADVPEVRVGNRGEAGPYGLVRGVPFPSLAEVAPEQGPHGRGHPCRQVHPVGDVADRHLVDGLVREHRLPHLAGHLPWRLLTAFVERAARMARG